MIPRNILPRALRKAPVEEQLAFLLQRRQTIEKLLQSLERYLREREGGPPEPRGSNSSAAVA